MKKYILLFVIVLICQQAYSQEDLDRTGFIGEVVSQLKIDANEATETETETSIETRIVFDSKTITINGEAYEVVNKEFDGIDLNTFHCRKRGSNYTLTFVVDDFISISDDSKPDQVTYFMEFE
jgi:hypothetical protein